MRRGHTRLDRQPPRPASLQTDHTALGRGESGWRCATPARDEQHTHVTRTTRVLTRTPTHVDTNMLMTLTRTCVCACRHTTRTCTRAHARPGLLVPRGLPPHATVLPLCLHSEITLPPPGAIKASSGGGCPGGRWPLGTGHSCLFIPGQACSRGQSPALGQRFRPAPAAGASETLLGCSHLRRGQGHGGPSSAAPRRQWPLAQGHAAEEHWPRAGHLSPAASPTLTPTANPGKPAPVLAWGLPTLCQSATIPPTHTQEGLAPGRSEWASAQALS